MLRKLFKISLVGVSLLGAMGVLVVVPHTKATASSPSQVSLIVMPHPDDEVEAWSLIARSPSNYKVFAYMTRGEQVSYCKPSKVKKSFRPEHSEIKPRATLTGRWTESCYNSRIASTLSFLNKMSTKDATIPGGFNANYYSTITLPSRGVKAGHVDNGRYYTDHSVRVYNSANGMGKAVFFNLGDGDLAESEVVWAIKSLKDSRSQLGIPNLRYINAIGPFYNRTNRNCNFYAHRDHYAVHRALFRHNFNFITSRQYAATCQTDRDAALTKVVPKKTWDSIFKVNTRTHKRIGYFQKYYGWLNNKENGWPVVTSAKSQYNGHHYPFMQRQSFWQRF